MKYVQHVQSHVAERLDESADRVHSGSEAQLYWCSECETTFLTDVMSVCPKCSCPVTMTPDERTLGYHSEDLV